MGTRPRQLLRRLLSGLVRLAEGVVAPESPWDRVTMRVPTTAFGPGSRRDFGHYIAGESRVRVQSIDEIVEWLRTCEYVSDTDLFHERDVWQHPGAFEQLRRGDCEDFALWAWRKLAEVGVDAEFYVGRVVCRDEPEIDRQHAWVVYRIDGADYLFEPAAQSRPRMIRPLEDVMDEYVPHFAVNRKLATSAFVGCILDSYRDRERRRRPESM
jgi:predicted transglutaminase-like cysteine proteinase